MIYRIVNPRNHDRVGWPAQEPEDIVGYMCKKRGSAGMDMSYTEILSGPLRGRMIELNNDRLIPAQLCPMESEA